MTGCGRGGPSGRQGAEKGNMGNGEVAHAAMRKARSAPLRSADGHHSRVRSS